LKAKNRALKKTETKFNYLSNQSSTFDCDDLVDQTTLKNPNFSLFSNNFPSKKKKKKKEATFNQKPRIFTLTNRIQKTMIL